MSPYQMNLKLQVCKLHKERDDKAILAVNLRRVNSGPFLELRTSPSISRRDQQPRFHNCLGLKKPIGISRGMPLVSVHQQLFPAPAEQFRSNPMGTVVLILLLLVLVLALGVALAVLAAPQVPVTPVTPLLVLGCPHGWMGYNGVCYYFSREYSTWEQGQERCSKLNAALAIAKDEEAMDLLFRLRGNGDFWLGLRRRGEHLHWGDGSSYSSRVPVFGNSECVYLADERFRSGNCSNVRLYVCSKAQAPL
ncbi:C-type lectin domain family 2 member D-like [Ammospiza maritima maritima]